MIASLISGFIGAGITIVGGLYWIRWYTRVARQSRDRMGDFIREHDVRWRKAIAECENLKYPDTLVPGAEGVSAATQPTSIA